MTRLGLSNDPHDIFWYTLLPAVLHGGPYEKKKVITTVIIYYLIPQPTTLTPVRNVVNHIIGIFI